MQPRGERVLLFTSVGERRPRSPGGCLQVLPHAGVVCELARQQARATRAAPGGRHEGVGVRRPLPDKLLHDARHADQRVGTLVIGEDQEDVGWRGVVPRAYGRGCGCWRGRLRRSHGAGEAHHEPERQGGADPVQAHQDSLPGP